jgi:hypothetical protein
VDKLHEMGLTIGDELEAQDTYVASSLPSFRSTASVVTTFVFSLIKRLGDEVEETRDRLTSAVKRVSELIDRSSSTHTRLYRIPSSEYFCTDATSYGVIIFLIVVLVLLLVVVFYI